jgi:O-acetylhomoserine/O-acetylserine sulfhydrylase-like pyridoxal-dependent enzyme
MRFLCLPLTGTFRIAAFLSCASFCCAPAVAHTTLPNVSSGPTRELDTRAAGVSPAFVRLSIGNEDPDDIIKDIDQASA